MSSFIPSISEDLGWVLLGLDKLPLTWSDGAEDGIRTRDPELIKERVLSTEPAQSLACNFRSSSFHPPLQSAPVVERSTVDWRHSSCSRDR